MRTKETLLTLLVTGLLLGLVAPVAQAQLAAQGPLHPDSGFPQWFQDTNGLALQLMKAPPADPFSISAEPVIGNAFSELIGFGAEGFWWVADARIDLGGGNEAILVEAVEAAFLTEDPIDGDQLWFSRIRIRIDTTVAGTYKVTYPYGTETFVNVPVGKRAINVTADLPPLTRSNIGPFLTWTPDLATPAGYIGDPGIPHTVTGSPTGNNFFRVEGPPGFGTHETNLFTVSGRIMDPAAVPTALVPARACYARSGPGRIELFASSSPTATVSVTGGANLPATPIALASDGAGNFFGVAELADATTLPPFVTFTAQDAVIGNAAYSKDVPLTDCVKITKATYSVIDQTMIVQAASNDLVVPPTLTAVGLGDLVAGVLVKPGVVAPPPTVTVTSSAGGSATIDVELMMEAVPVVAPPQLPPPPIAPPPGQTITVQQPTFSTRSASWKLSNGRLTPAQAGVVVTVHLGADTTGPVIGAATVNNTGQWSLLVRRSPVVPPAGAVISLQASTGAKALAIPIRIRR